MRNLLLTVFVPLLCISMIPPPASALSCDVSQSCSGTVLLRMSAKYNAHAEVPSSPQGFSWLLCCRDDQAAIGTACGAARKQTFLLLSSPADAHVSTAYGGFPYEACISAANDVEELQCIYSLDYCPEGYACLASLYGNTVSEATNTHISACDDPSFRMKVCCRISVAPPLVVHNISEFTTRRLYMPHNTREDIAVKVKNRHASQAATIELSLDGPAKFHAGPSRIMPSISTDGRTATFTGVPPKSEDMILATISPLYPLQDGVYTITLTASSTVETSAETDVLEIVSHQPPSFASLGWLSVCLLIAASAALFHFLGKRK